MWIPRTGVKSWGLGRKTVALACSPQCSYSERGVGGRPASLVYKAMDKMPYLTQGGRWGQQWSPHAHPWHMDLQSHTQTRTHPQRSFKDRPLKISFWKYHSDNMDLNRCGEFQSRDIILAVIRLSSLRSPLTPETLQDLSRSLPSIPAGYWRSALSGGSPPHNKPSPFHESGIRHHNLHASRARC